MQHSLNSRLPTAEGRVAPLGQHMSLSAAEPKRLTAEAGRSPAKPEACGLPKQLGPFDGRRHPAPPALVFLLLGRPLRRVFSTNVAGLDELDEVVGPAGLLPMPLILNPPKGWQSDQGSGDLAVDVDVADLPDHV